ncbi:MAG: TauD/TfdA family dioxygenase [Alphaproteobacteria bacterium]|jgi:taurine dioxygenase|nr:taurine dioxygenase [Rhodospirillaceae bacterium]MDP6253949.1 TauD/TfdA family dioxygenase [Alphaproteobacteria bacterium]MDP7056702.1 TauD/TfdA family dioxygenase [Alphaproteobacteria bacterium]MDP7227546.1 TauD/TfdA family dioxygenase [Alphaproteobacteria bacterium]HJM90762.1 TauD/TfdA family dioxygenase [Alphaproteobacteria bacterium]
MGYQSLDVEPLAGAMGAVIHGVDLTAELSNQAFDEIHQAFLEYKAVFFHSQDLDPHQQIAFARRFGPMTIYPFMEGLPEAPEAFEILKTETDVRNFGGGWHSDMSFTTKPPLGTMLYALEMPDAGGDTMFANTALAYDALSGGMKDMLDGLVGIYSAALKRGGGRAKSFKAATAMSPKNMDQVEMEAEHPIVRTHPETGRKALFLGKGHTVRFKDMTEEESLPLINYLVDHCVRPEFTCRFSWGVGSLALWDNRCTLHFAIDDYPGQRRRMRRLTVEGDTPV